jgi:hypothetical protein
MPIDDRWGEFEPSQWDGLAQAWIAQLRSTRGEEVNLCASADECDVGSTVTQMSFTATPDQQWKFILLAMKHAETDEELGHIAAGPMEHLLGWHGDQYIAIVEQEAQQNPKFARMLTGVCKYLMNDTVWQRIESLQGKARSQEEQGDKPPLEDAGPGDRK